MKRYRLCLSGIALCAFFVMAFFPNASFAERCEKWAAKVVSVQGTVEARLKGEKEWRPVRLDDTYCPGDVIRVQEKSRADVALGNHPVLRLDENSTIVLGGLKDERTSLVELVGGAVHFFSRVVRNLEVQTAFVNAGVEGTEGAIRVEKDRTLITIFEGKVLATNEAGSLSITSGQSAVAEKGKAPAPWVVVRPWDAVQWALYYPPVVYYRPTDFQGFPEIQKSIELYWKGDLTGAFSSIGKVPESTRDPRFFTYRASLLLTVGRVEDASKDIERALSLNPKDSDAFALQSIVAVAQNDREKALVLARKAIEAAPNSAAAKVALSYAQQANFDLRGALASLEEAVRLEPENALAWARLSELQLSFAKLDDALVAAQKAATLDPNLSRTQTVLGFAYLAQIRTGEAKAAFEKAIQLDQAAPLPRLGIGLAMIHQSNLTEGGRQIEVAMSLDPENSLIRSYLGKAYFEEKRGKLASQQFDMAEELDPLDPTPYFYDAIHKQTTNRPVEALHDMQKAIELNDNRAVYRSRLLLDRDLAARSASLARIYSDLGFQELALVEGWKSVNTGPSNYSAHRFLADSYSALPRHEIARVSELLQSLLLQPINISPVQPHLAEGNLFVVEGGGPAEASFNEFNPLFLRNRFAVQASGIFGENKTVGDELVVSGLHDNFSASAGQYHFETDGFRRNSDLKDDIQTVFFQLDLSYKTSVMAEIRKRDTDRGDLALRFFNEPTPSPLAGFSPNLRTERETTLARFGFHHAFSPSSELLGTVMYQELDSSLHDSPDPVLVSLDIKTKEDARGLELQHLFSSKYVKTVAGAGYFDVSGREDTTSLLLLIIDPLLPPIPVQSTDTAETDIEHSNLYIYSYINFPKSVTFTLGASGDFFKGGYLHLDKDQFNPKFGVTWNPLADTTLRAAAFRTLKRTLIALQTLEPTQVAGFNQFYDDFESTDAWRYGVAVDQKFSKSIFGGAEYSLRDLDVPFSAGEADWKERLGRVYLYWTASDWLALTGEYDYEKFERTEEVNLGAKEVKTQRFPLGINFYHPSGFSVRLKGTYFDQKGVFLPVGAAPLPGNFVSGGDQFWLFDAAVSYRLPKRRGFVTVGGKNLFDKTFDFFDTDDVNPSIQPDKVVFVRVTLSI
jgi:tetratricopeptide (TPR) repeat protein